MSHSPSLQKGAALLEVIGVLIVGTYVGSRLAEWCGLNGFGSLNFAAGDFVALSVDWLKILLLQYSCLLIPAFAIGWWRRRADRRYYGFTLAGRSAGALVLTGLLAFALGALPLKLLWAVHQLAPLGPEPFFWRLLDREWTPAFWLFLAVASFGATPILEEVFYRGYCQSRLEEAFGGPAAAIIVALFMTLGHNQYHHLTTLSVATLLALLPLTLAIGLVYWATRSLIPPIVLHAAANFQTKGVADLILPGLMIVLLIAYRNRWIPALSLARKQAGSLPVIPAVIAAVVASGCIIAYEREPARFVLFGVFALAAGLVLSRSSEEVG